MHISSWNINNTRNIIGNGGLKEQTVEKASYHPKQNQDSARPQIKPTTRLVTEETRRG